jgi:hypothetical protein
LTLRQLRNGQLVTIQPNLVRRLKSHFISLPCGVDLILALNGYIWVSKHVKETEQEGEEGFDAEAVYSNRNDVSGALYVWRLPSILTKLSIPPGHRCRNANGDFPHLQHYSRPVSALRSAHRHSALRGLRVAARARR